MRRGRWMGTFPRNEDKVCGPGAVIGSSHQAAKRREHESAPLSCAVANGSCNCVALGGRRGTVQTMEGMEPEGCPCCGSSLAAWMGIVLSVFLLRWLWARRDGLRLQLRRMVG